MVGYPPLDVVDRPDLALGQDGDRFRKIRAGRQLVDPLATDAEQFPDLMCAGQARRLGVHAHDYSPTTTGTRPSDVPFRAFSGRGSPPVTPLPGRGPPPIA